MTLPRFLGCIFVTYLALLFSSTWWNILLPSFFPMPNVALILLIYFSLQSPSAMAVRSPSTTKSHGPAVLVGLGGVLGYVCDLLSFTPRGLQSLLLSLCALSLWALSTKLLVRGLWFLIGVTVFTALAYNGALYGLRSWMSPQLSRLEWRFILLATATTVVCAPFVFVILGRLDSRMLKRAPSLGIALP